MKRKLTRLERWLLWKRRLGLTQVEAASDYNVSEDTVVGWDRGNGKIPSVGIGRGDPTPGEMCWLARRVARREINDIARDLRVTRISILNWEKDRGGTQRLIRYWDSQRRKAS